MHSINKFIYALGFYWALVWLPYLYTDKMASSIWSAPGRMLCYWLIWMLVLFTAEALISAQVRNENLKKELDELKENQTATSSLLDSMWKKHNELVIAIEEDLKKKEQKGLKVEGEVI